jgi:hypothetical protein
MRNEGESFHRSSERPRRSELVRHWNSEFLVRVSGGSTRDPVVARTFQTIRALFKSPMGHFWLLILGDTLPSIVGI